jgi:ATP-dependent Lon protease
MNRIILHVLVVFALSISAVLCVQVHDLKKVNRVQAETIQRLAKEQKSVSASAQANTDTLLRHSADIQRQARRVSDAEERLTKLERAPRPTTAAAPPQKQWDGKDLVGGKADAWKKDERLKQDWQKEQWQKEGWDNFKNAAGNEEWNAEWEEAVRAKKNWHMEQQRNRMIAEELLKKIRDEDGDEDGEEEAILRQRLEQQQKEGDERLEALKERFQRLQQQRGEAMKRVQQQAVEAEAKRKIEFGELRIEVKRAAEPTEKETPEPTDEK